MLQNYSKMGFSLDIPMQSCLWLFVKASLRPNSLTGRGWGWGAPTRGWSRCAGLGEWGAPALWFLLLAEGEEV